MEALLVSCAEGFSLIRKKRKLLKEKRKQRERVELKMDLPGVSIADNTDSSLFSLSSIKKQKVFFKELSLSTIAHISTAAELLRCVVFVHQVMADISKGDMQAADNLEDEDNDIHISDDEDAADEMSLASDLDEEDLEEVEKRKKELKKKTPKM